MASSARFSYSTFSDAHGATLLRPIIPIDLTYVNRVMTANALLDTGADANILPYSLGVELGRDWDKEKPISGISGNLSQSEARAIILTVTIAPFDPLRMLFIWVKTDIARVILGQINFFQEFDVCFFASAEKFELQRKT
jgi:hypothetical protein